MGAKTYRIVSGTFRLEDGTVLEQGETLELEEDIAALHAGRVEPVVETPKAE